MAERYDIVIVGGAALGSAIAAFLGMLGEGRPSVLVVERDPTYRHSSTALSLASIRQQFSCAENIAISRFGVDFLRNLGAWLAVDGEVPDVGFKEGGYLILAPESGLDVLRRNHALQRAQGADVALLDAATLHARFPWLNTEGIAAGSLGLSGEGWFDPHSLLRAFRAKARALGAVYRTDSVTGIRRAGGRVTGVRLASGDEIPCGAVVNAAGPAARKVAALAGLELPVHPRKRSVFVFDCKQAIPDLPLLADPSGVYARPEGRYYIAGSTPPESEDRDCEDFEVDWWRFEEIVWPALAHRIPAFQAIKPLNAWAGHYAVTPFDHNAILGPHPDVSNFYFANGFSGHGLQQSPAVGRGIAEHILTGGYRGLDLSAFAYDRIAANRPLRELNVI